QRKKSGKQGQAQALFLVRHGLLGGSGQTNTINTDAMECAGFRDLLDVSQYLSVAGLVLKCLPE
ncbi:MAG: hypothetical protein R3312_06330, partial [Gammaproteobacteria bacterium]|nr:hypothetical protein [Gammaproteobacteria bacterium]